MTTRGRIRVEDVVQVEVAQAMRMVYADLDLDEVVVAGLKDIARGRNRDMPPGGRRVLRLARQTWLQMRDLGAVCAVVRLFPELNQAARFSLSLETHVATRLVARVHTTFPKLEESMRRVDWLRVLLKAHLRCRISASKWGPSLANDEPGDQAGGT